MTVQTPTSGQTTLEVDGLAAIRQSCLDDAFLFATEVCGHHDLTLKFHMPLVYLAAGQIDKLIGLLQNPDYEDSYVIQQIRRECVRLKINFWTEKGAERFRHFSRFVNIRVFRRSGKSSAITHSVRLWKMTRDPNLTSAIISNTADKAKDFCKQIRRTILGDVYGALFPERIPDDAFNALTENNITLKGRTVPDKEPCLMAFGHKSSPTSYHFDEIHLDDLVGQENRSVVELEMVSEFLANISGLYSLGIRYPICRSSVGTRWDDEDDDTKLRANPNCFTVTVPIWVRDTMTDDITTPGTATCEWYPVEKALDLQMEVLSNPEEGALSWRCNYELDPAIGGGRIFSQALVDQQKWTPYANAAQTKGIEWVARPDFDKDGKKKISAETGKQLYFSIDKKQLYIVTACDQSFSETGDEWSVGTVGMDQYGHRYVIEMRHGHTEELMLDAMLMAYITWKPRKIGQEKIAASHLIELVLKLNPKYRVLRGVIEPISHGNKPKEWRIRNYVSEMLRMRRLWLDPRDPDTANEAVRYKPGKNAKDNALDVLAMCEVLIQRSLKPKEDEESFIGRLTRRNAVMRARRDPQTGIRVA